MGTNKTGGATIKVDDSLDMMAEKVIKGIDKEFLKIIKAEMEKLKDTAKKKWLIRSKNSQRSIDKFKIVIEKKQGSLSGSVGNTAEYAGAIFYPTGKNSSSSAAKHGSRKNLSNEVLWRPLKERIADRITRKLIEKMLKMQD